MAENKQRKKGYNFCVLAAKSAVSGHFEKMRLVADLPQLRISFEDGETKAPSRPI
jgi:hypothetical protein